MVSATGNPQTIYTLAIAIVWQYYNFDAIDGPLGPNMADYGCRTWSQCLAISGIYPYDMQVQLISLKFIYFCTPKK